MKCTEEEAEKEQDKWTDIRQTIVFSLLVATLYESILKENVD